MDVKNLSQAHGLLQKIGELKREHDIVAAGGGLGVTVQSQYQDNEFVNAIRPHLLAELNKRIQAKQDHLKQLNK
ncbi:hypothetical protein [Hafnia psychrotolerans]|uniref:Uncharacterized protein n=1 Tax=Hafnia psychrotolerans TaxID=1477018 RepID=A0ABQ1G7N3_9GAMM|nr:hypothetical protein [Hafnia psychrotolerans]GGA38340.1 hypothetical protein GCM10011328_11470 [Hafnia psychrotolerans]